MPTKIETGLPADLLAYLEVAWPARVTLERTYALPALGAEEHMITLTEARVREELVTVAIERELFVCKIDRVRWYRRPAEFVDRQVIVDANPIPLDRRDIPWNLNDPVVLTDTLICRFSAEAVPALLEEPAVEEVPDDGEQ